MITWCILSIVIGLEEFGLTKNRQHPEYGSLVPSVTQSFLCLTAISVYSTVQYSTVYTDLHLM